MNSNSALCSFLAAVITASVLANHWTEPAYDYYYTANKRNVQYSPDVNLRFYQPHVQIQMKHSDENGDNDQLNVTVVCIAHPSNMKVVRNDLVFEIANATRNESRSMDETVTFRYVEEESERVTLENWSRNRASFILTNDYRSWMSDYNYINDDELLLKVFSHLLKDGKLTIEVQDSGTQIKGILIARPYPHISGPLFETASECHYGAMHPDVNSQESGGQSSSASHGRTIDPSILERNPLEGLGPGLEVFDSLGAAQDD